MYNKVCSSYIHYWNECVREELEMKDKLILKALVCGAFMCSLSVGTMAADVNTDVKAGDTEQSSWMDGTDIGIGLQGTQKDSYHDYARANEQMTDNNLEYNTRFHYRNHNSKQKMNAKYFIETLQPIKKYDKSMVFVQGRLDGNGGEKISTNAYWNGSDAYGTLATV